MSLITLVTRYCPRNSSYDLVHTVNAYFFFQALSSRGVHGSCPDISGNTEG